MGYSVTTSGSCKGKTKAGGRCGQSSIYPNGYCRHHGGAVPPGHFEAYKQRVIEQVQRRTNRMLRRMRKRQREAEA